MRKPKIISAAVLTILAVILIVQNTQIMITRFLFWDVTLSRSLTMLIVFFTGVLIGLLIPLLRKRSKRKIAASAPVAEVGVEAEQTT